MKGKPASLPLISERLLPASELLAQAYRRPCNICGREGHCGHREPAVELAHYRVALSADPVVLLKLRGVA